MKKKIFAILVSAMMLVSLLPATSFAYVWPDNALESVGRTDITKKAVKAKKYYYRVYKKVKVKGKTYYKRTNTKKYYYTYKMVDTAGTSQERAVETLANTVANDTVAGGYKLCDTDTVKGWIDNQDEMVIIDTMPAGWFNKRHIKDAVNAWAPLAREQAGETWDSTAGGGEANAKQALLDAAGSDKAAKIVVYCGFTKCTRSHMGAEYLVSQGYTNVYRYTGGISAWFDAQYPIGGSDAE